MSATFETSIDLRSDTVTRPTAEMRAAMASAAVGDDVYGDDPTVNKLQQATAELFGFEAAMFAPSGTQSNLIALLTHCGRGDEYLVGQEAHTYKYEGGGAAVLGSIQPQPLPQQPDGSLALNDIVSAIKPDDIHFAKTRVLALENTIGGRVLSRSYLDAATALAKQHGLIAHLDGARICNAAIKQGLSMRDATAGFESVSVCLSKGLGAPVGSVLCGSKDMIRRALRWRKMLGGGMRQAGILAAAGLYALEHHIERLVEDHENASRLAVGLSEIEALHVTAPQTNITYAEIPPVLCAELQQYLHHHGIIATVKSPMRLVTHLDISRAAIDHTIIAFKQFFHARR